jgi:four helix bundle protein
MMWRLLFEESAMNRGFVEKHQELAVYQLAFENAMWVFELVQGFPEEERRSLSQPLVQASRLVCTKIAESWQKRRYREAFVARLNQAEVAAAEVQTWVEFAVLCSYLEAQTGQELLQQYHQILAGIGRLIDHAEAWEI